MALLGTANKLTWDFPRSVHDDIISGRFASRMKRYQRQRSGRKPLGFQDFGAVRNDMEFEEMVNLYLEICEHDQLNEERRLRCERGEFL